jgi:predicted esterase
MQCSCNEPKPQENVTIILHGMGGKKTSKIPKNDSLWARARKKA